MDFAHHKNRVRRKSGDSLLEGEEILAAFLLRPLGSMKREVFKAGIGQITGAVMGAVYGGAAGAAADQGLETGVEAGFQDAEMRSKARSDATATRLPDASFLFVITDRRFLIFGSKRGSAKVRYAIITAFPLSAITDMQMTLGLVANVIHLKFADGTYVARDLPFGQGNHRRMIEAFTRVREEAFQPQTPPAHQAVDERGDQITPPNLLASNMEIMRSRPSTLPSRLRSVTYSLGRVLLPLSLGGVAVILILLLHLLFDINISGEGSSPTPAWVSSVNNYCRTVAEPAFKKSGILAAATPAEYVRAVPAAARISSRISYRMDQYLNSVHGSAELVLLSMGYDWGQVAKYERAAAKAYLAGNSASFEYAVKAANSFTMDSKHDANLLRLYDCIRVG